VTRGYQVETGLDEGEEAQQLRDLQEQIRIEPPREPEVDPAIYRDVESLIYRGFLVLPAEINGVQFLFKSMNHHEFEYLQWVTGGRTGERYYNTFLAFCVFMIDGSNVLPERDRFVSDFEAAFASFTTQARSKMIRHLSEINRRAANAVTMTEAYQMERISRFRWAQYRGLELMSTSCTGVDGSNKLGMNYAQLVWRALNHYDDLRDTTEREWENAKFIGSCFAGKEIRKIYSQDKDRRHKEAEERIQRKDQVIRQVLTGEDPKNQTNGQVRMVVARSVEELAQQLERDLRGERDWHDEVVAREEEALRQQVLSRREQLREIQEKKEKDGVPLAQAHSDISKGFTAEEVKERITRGRQLEYQKVAGRVLHPEMQDERIHSFIQRHLLPDEETSAETLAKRGPDQDLTNVQPIVPPRPPGTPFRR
jgi:bacterioferritin (cytochrome b1)